MKQAELINIDSDFYAAVELAAKLYSEDGVFIYPTDTIYGIGGNPFSKDVVERIKQIKGRSDEQRFILLINEVDNLKQFVEFAESSHIEFLSRLWPAPVSIILKLNDIYNQKLGYEDIAFRIPDNKYCLSLLNKINQPLISTSVNRTGEKPLNNPEQIFASFKDDIDAIFYSEEQSKISASTLIELKSNEPKLIREGKVKYSSILEKM